MTETKANSKLEMWQDRRAESDRFYDSLRVKMDHREQLYAGDHNVMMPELTRKMREAKPVHVRNIVFENIESEVSSNIPMPKITPRRRKDEHLAELIEHYLRNERDRLPFERINDMAERTVPIQGGVAYFVDWDNTQSTHDTVGELDVNAIHPKQVKPQPGIDDVEKMDWIILAIPTTKETIKRVYGKSVYNENESEPELRTTANGELDNAEDTVTMYIGYERNSNGGIDRYTWVNDVELEDLDDYQARRQPVCRNCGKVRPLRGQIITGRRAGLPDAYSENPQNALFDKDTLLQARAGRMMAAGMAEQMMSGEESDELLPGMTIGEGKEPEPDRYDGGPCPYCGSEEWDSQVQDYEQVLLPIRTGTGMEIPGATMGLDELGQPVMQPTLVPYYKPKGFPIVIQKNVSIYGQLWGSSDVDTIEDQQHTTNRLSKKIIDRLMKAGTRHTLPDRADFRMDPEDGETWYIGNAADKAMIETFQFEGNLQYELEYRAQVYEEARQMLGITDSFQGRRDSTAQSGRAKEFAAQQSAGRLESKRVNKDAAYADLYRMMFEYILAYGDEPRSVTYSDEKGQRQYEEFSRYDFLEQDEEGNYYWNDQFLFSVDTSSNLEANREQMWKETRDNLQSGAFGDSTALETLILFWSKMEELHYPGAKSTKKYLEDRLQEAMAAPPVQPTTPTQTTPPMGGMPTEPPQSPGFPG